MVIKPKIAKQQPRRVFKFHKADWPNIKSETAHLSNTILNRAILMTTQQMWDETELECTWDVQSSAN